jgi:hypothetical protein
MSTIWTPISTSAPPPTVWASNDTVPPQVLPGLFNGNLLNVLPLNGG